MIIIILLHIRICLLPLADDTDDTTTATSGLGVLTADTVTPEMTETLVKTHTLHALNVITQLGVKLVDKEVGGLAVSGITLTVKAPAGNLELLRVLGNGNNTLKLFNSEFTGTLGHVNIGLLADNVGETGGNTTDFCESIHNLDVTVDVSREQTQNVLEVTFLGDGQRHVGC